MYYMQSLGNNNPKKVNTTDISNEFIEKLALKKISDEKDFNDRTRISIFISKYRTI